MIHDLHTDTICTLMLQYMQKKYDYFLYMSTTDEH